VTSTVGTVARPDRAPQIAHTTRFRERRPIGWRLEDPGTSPVWFAERSFPCPSIGAAPRRSRKTRCPGGCCSPLGGART
jgi:hypothetical protein